VGGEVDETMPPVERLLDPLLRLLGGCGEAEKPGEGRGRRGRREDVRREDVCSSRGRMIEM
jgi:hypothetical protein